MTTDMQMLLKAIEESSPSVRESMAQLLQLALHSEVLSVIATRSLNGLARALEQPIPADVANAPSDLGVLLRVLETPESVELLSHTDPLAAAKVRGLRAREQLLMAEGGVVSSLHAAELLGMSLMEIDKRLRNGHLIGLSLGKRGFVYPIWQFVEGGTLPGLESVLTELHDHDAWMQTAFMVNSNTRLNGESPLALLRRGEVEAVRAAAGEYGKQGAA